jgi:hypothetical protein
MDHPPEVRRFRVCNKLQFGRPCRWVKVLNLLKIRWQPKKVRKRFARWLPHKLQVWLVPQVVESRELLEAVQLVVRLAVVWAGQSLLGAARALRRRLRQLCNQHRLKNRRFAFYPSYC